MPNIGSPIAQTGMPSPMLWDIGDPITLAYPCGLTSDPTNSYLGLPFYNMSPGVARPLWICTGTSWVQALPAILGTTTSIGGALILLNGSISTTTSVPGAPIGANCMATRADGALLPIGLQIDCAVLTTGVATVRISALVAGTPSAGVYNVRVLP